MTLNDEQLKELLTHIQKNKSFYDEFLKFNNMYLHSNTEAVAIYDQYFIIEFYEQEDVMDKCEFLKMWERAEKVKIDSGLASFKRALSKSIFKALTYKKGANGEEIRPHDYIWKKNAEAQLLQFLKENKKLAEFLYKEKENLSYFGGKFEAWWQENKRRPARKTEEIDKMDASSLKTYLDKTEYKSHEKPKYFRSLYVKKSDETFTQMRFARQYALKKLDKLTLIEKVKKEIKFESEEKKELFIKLISELDENLRDKDGNSPLHIAVKIGSLNAVNFFLDEGEGRLSLNYKKETPLDLAININNENLIQCLLGKPSIKSEKTKENVIQKEVIKENLKILKKISLKEFNIDDNANDILQEAVFLKKIEIIDFFIEHKNKLKLTDENKSNLLSMAALDKNTSLIQRLIRLGIDINLKDKNGNTILNSAIAMKDKKFISFLLSSGADINLKNKNGQTVLHTAILSGNVEFAKKLIIMNKFINVKDKDGNTPLHLAFKMNNLEICRLLSKRNAKGLIKNKEGKTPMELAKDKKSKEKIMSVLQISENKECIYKIKKFINEMDKKTLLFGYRTSYNAAKKALKKLQEGEDYISVIKEVKSNKKATELNKFI